MHACWDDAAIDQVRSSTSAISHHKTASERIDARLNMEQVKDKVDRNLAFQNENPIKMITSGRECRAESPFVANGRLRQEARHPWWNEYDAEPACVCGHYWRTPVEGKPTQDTLFKGCSRYDPLGKGRVFCIDYSVGFRFQDRKRGNGFSTNLGALRWPERKLQLDDETIIPILDRASQHHSVVEQ